MQKTIISLILFITCASFCQNEEYHSYCNSRFGFCMKYPSAFKMKQQSENGDGAIFTSPDKKTTIRAYGRLSVEDLDKLDQEYNFATDGINVTYRVMKKNWFIFSGTDNKGNMVYQKTIKKAVDYMGDANTDVFQTVQISYPAAQNDKYAAYCGVVAKSL